MIKKYILMSNPKTISTIQPNPFSLLPNPSPSPPNPDTLAPMAGGGACSRLLILSL